MFCDVVILFRFPASVYLICNTSMLVLLDCNEDDYAIRIRDMLESLLCVGMGVASFVVCIIYIKLRERNISWSNTTTMAYQRSIDRFTRCLLARVLRDFKDDKGDKGDKGDKSDKGDEGDEMLLQLEDMILIYM